MSTAAGLPPGLLMWPSSSSEGLAEVLDGARARGCFIARTGSAADDDRFDVLRRIGRALSFPAWYRPNWDAFSDCLHDLSWLDVGPRLVIVDGTESLRCEEDDSAQVLVEILARACWFWAGTPSPLTVVLAG